MSFITGLFLSIMSLILFMRVINLESEKMTRKLRNMKGCIPEYERRGTGLKYEI